MADLRKLTGKAVFGLDIGTRSIVGTVGYKKGDTFHVIALQQREHTSRSMLDGQIHDIVKVGATIREVKKALEDETGIKLDKVCIAAAGRVLKTVDVHTEIVFEEARTVTQEDVYALKTDGVQKAYDEFPKKDTDNTIYYCVGSTVVRYYMNGYQIVNPEEHKAESIGADIIATFLPEDVVDGLYKAVGLAGLDVAALTLEPIAAIQVAIPERFRMLNLALVDVGAGTSDICITNDGAVLAYGMIPLAGDSLTETIAKACLVDFTTAELIKRGIAEQETVEYTDIMGLPQKITREEVLKILDGAIDQLATAAADKIMELNGDKSVSAVFVVGGGGKILTYTDKLADKLDIVTDRVALRGEAVLHDVEFDEELEIVPDSTLVTPIGICLNYYEQSNNFIFVTFNHEKIKLYNNDKLAVVDAALQADYSNEQLFPRRGEELHFTVNGKPRVARGQLGEAAEIKVNGMDSNIYAPIHENDVITVVDSTVGAPAEMTVGGLPEFRDIISVQVQDKRVNIPKFAKVNGVYQSAYYNIQEGDEIEILDYCTVAQILEFMDILLPEEMQLFVNHKAADRESRVYENYLVGWKAPGDTAFTQEAIDDAPRKAPAQEAAPSGQASADDTEQYETLYEEDDEEETDTTDDELMARAKSLTYPLHVNVNGSQVTLEGKSRYVFVDVFDYIDFDLKHPQGNGVAALLNGREAQYMETLHEGDTLQIYWRE
ncbi:MAG: cell division protein FtsA [Lachnospiraceae bacterium]|nr:cell division protein FtsA [Lachnospiraceae bacterium]